MNWHARLHGLPLERPWRRQPFVVTDENGTVAADILQGERGPPVFHQRACALPGFLARTNWGYMPQAVHDPESIKTIARDLVTTCVQRALQTKTGLAPSLDQATGRVGDLRPETASSLFFMRRVTQDPYYANLGYDLFRKLNASSRIQGGAFATIDDVEIGNKRDEQPPRFRDPQIFISATVGERNTEYLS